MSLARNYDRTLRRRFALRAVWTPGTRVSVGDIMRLRNGSLVSVGNLRDEQIAYSETPIAVAQSMSIKSSGVYQTLLQNGAKVALNNLDPAGEAELRITFNAEDSYLLKTPELSGTGMEQSMKVAKEAARIPGWDFRENYIVQRVWTAGEFTFLGTLEKGKTLSFRGSGEAIRKLLAAGIDSGNTLSTGSSLSYKVTGSSGPVVMQVFRVKRNGEMY